MAVLILNPTKDNTIFKSFPSKNIGLDEQLIIGNEIKTLLGFDIAKINQLNPDKIEFRLFLSVTEELPEFYLINVNPISSYWSEGLGTYYGSPDITSGSNWNNSNTNIINTNVSQSYSVDSSKDITIDITNLYKNSNISNGIRLSTNDFSDNSFLYYFSRHTKSVHLPNLTLKYSDSTQNYSGSIISGSLLISTGNVGDLKSNTSYRMNIFAREKVNKREFRTSVKTKHFLPMSSHYSLRDINLDYSIIEADSIYTVLIHL